MDLEFNKNEDKMRLLISEMTQKFDKVSLGGGKSKIKKQHEQGKLTARERIDFLLDDDSESIEIGAFVGDGMYEEYGDCPSGGVVIIIGYVSKKQCIVVANDATGKAGAWFPITAKKNLRAQEIAMENKLPIIYLVDSAGVFLPLQDEIFPDKEHFGRIFRNNAKMSSMGITQISAVMGSCVAGGAYLPIMSDEALIVNKTGTIFLAGSYQVTLTDAIGCVGVSDEVRIDSVAPILILDTLLSDSICPEANNGWIQLNALSNRPPLTYNWGTQEGNRIENLSAGNYSLSLSDASGCPFPLLEFTIAEFAQPEIEIDTFFQGEQICFGVGSTAALDSFSWLVQSNKITDTVICISPIHQSSVILEVYFGNQCISAYHVFGTTSHQYDRSNFINIFPNPTSQYIRVVSDNIPIQYIEIWDALGRKSMIIEDPGTQPLIDLKGLANGSYWIRFFDQNGWIGTKNIVKQ